MLYRAKVTRVTGEGVYVEIPNLAPGYEYGPCTVSAEGDYTVGSWVLVGYVEDISDDITIIGEMRSVNSGPSPHRPFYIDPQGVLSWGDGVNPRDTNLYRSGPGTLKTDGNFYASELHANALNADTIDGATITATEVDTDGISADTVNAATIDTATVNATTANTTQVNATKVDALDEVKIGGARLLKDGASDLKLIGKLTGEEFAGRFLHLNSPVEAEVFAVSDSDIENPNFVIWSDGYLGWKGWSGLYDHWIYQDGVYGGLTIESAEAIELTTDEVHSWGEFYIWDSLEVDGDLTVWNNVEFRSSAMRPKQAENSTRWDFNNTSGNAGTPVVGLTFVAPPSGAVWINVHAFLGSQNNGLAAYVGYVIKTGGTVDSGTTIVGPSYHRAISPSRAVNTGAAATIGASIRRMHSGLTPGETYNVVIYQWVTGTGNAFVEGRTISVEPVY